MMEKVDRNGQEEFIWAMRTRALLPMEEDSESWKDRSVSSVSYDHFMYEDMSQNIENINESNIKTLASLLPDEIIFDSLDYNPRHYQACVLYGFISGFEDLCEKFSQGLKGGPSQLTLILNAYLGTIIQEILSYSGDIITFSANSFLAIWKTVLYNQSLQDCIHQALDCALRIKKSHEKFETHLGVDVKVKIVVAAGELVFSLIGTKDLSHYVCVGQPVLEAAEVSQIASGGNVIVTSSAWDYINPNEYNFQIPDNNSYMEVRGVATNWRSTQRNFTKTDISIDIAPGSTSSLGDASDLKEIFEMRVSIGAAMKSILLQEFRKFILPPLMQAIEMGDSIESLTEMRQIVVLHINLNISNFEVLQDVKTIDKTYSMICRFVTSDGGCVIQLTFVDDNMRFLVIFGFRGYKHELECQRALKCGMKCFKVLSAIPDVDQAGVSVTTGIAYCGAIGHMLRREYTVIGTPLYRALHLTSLNKPGVICDRDTFLQSKLEANYFIFQDHVLEAFNLGPVYEFMEKRQPRRYKYPLIYYPMLDRDIELTAYLDLLNSSCEMGHYNTETDQMLIRTLIIFGKAMEGKTRLTEEIVYQTPSNIPTFRIQLIASDRNVPYQTIYFIFSLPLGIQEKTSFADVETKLISKLQQIKAPQLYCLLNGIFRVNFEKSSIFNTLTETQKNYILKIMIKQLSYTCFRKLWVIIIDGGEFIDIESWYYIKYIMETFRVIFVIAISTNEELNEIAHRTIKKPYVQVIHLRPIDKWYLAGLACQFLEVFGIPAELEKILQNKSNGNPGWIQNYLITLLQEHTIEIGSILLNSIDQYGLVLPTPHMIARYSDGPKDSLGENIISFTNIYKFLQNKWEIYKFSYKDSATKVLNLPMVSGDTRKYSSMENLDTSTGRRVDVCFIKSNANLYDACSESTFDLITKIFDYLSSYEQLLLKCSSVIGEIFRRDMLNYLMTPDNEKNLALAIKRLFEIGVLACAQEKFMNESSNRPIVNGANNALACECQGLQIPESCHDLPKYASCQFLYFKIKSFREATYGMLTMYQKKEYHIRAVRYLEKKVRRCEKCGGGFFSKILGVRYDDGINKLKRKITLTPAMDVSYANMPRNNCPKRSTVSSTLESVAIFELETNKSFKSLSSGSKDMSKVSSGSISRRANFNYMRFQKSFVRTFSSFDFSGCECNKILYNMYRQIREHCEATDLMEKWMEATFAYTTLCIETYNVPTAINVLHNALAIVDAKYSSAIKPGENWKIPITKAKLYTLLGKARLEVGQLKASYKEFEQALKCFGYSFPHSLSIRVKIMEFQQCLMLHHFFRYGVGTKTSYAADFCDRLSECLSLMCTLFMDLDLSENAEVAAIWSLKKALQSERDFPILITAFANLINTYIRNRKFKHLVALEVKAVGYCNRYRSPVELNDLAAVLQLYSSIFTARIFRGELQGGINMGCLLIKICSALNKKFIYMSIFPLFIYVLMLKCKICEAVSVLLTAQQSAVNELDQYGITWFYALCICIHLDTGYTVVPFKLCENYYLAKTYNRVLHRESTAEKRYYSCMWLWYLRNEHYEKAETWELRIKKIWTLKHNDNIVNIITGLYYLEALLLSVINTLDRKHDSDVDLAFNEIDSLFAILSSNANDIQMIAPRLQHLYAYYMHVKQAPHDGTSELNKALKLAESTGSRFDENWIKHSMAAWNRDLSSIEYNFWRDHAESNTISYKLLDNNDKLGYYTLESQLYA